AICSDCSPSTFVTIMRTGRISDLRRGHLRAEFVPKLRVESFHRSDSEGCTIVTIERHSPDRFFDRSLIYVRFTRTRVGPSRVFLLYRTDNRLPTPPRTTPSWVSAEVLANHKVRCSCLYCPWYSTERCSAL